MYLCKFSDPGTRGVCEAINPVLQQLVGKPSLRAVTRSVVLVEEKNHVVLGKDCILVLLVHQGQEHVDEFFLNKGDHFLLFFSMQ